MGQLGQLLTRAREARGLTLEDAERDTRISRRYLQALEDEEFEAIPAPVYARGFLRSYSQYLGLDPQETIVLFNRSEEEISTAPPPRRASMQEPISPVGPARPSWRRPDQQPRPAGTRANAPDFEPVIGIDIGVPVPARRINTDPAAQARTATVAFVAIAVVAAVLLFAFLISRLADDGTSMPPGGSGDQSDQDSPTAVTEPTTAGNITGFVPSVVGMEATEARTELEGAGYRVAELSESSTQPEGIVVDQSPAPEASLAPGSTVTIVVSTGS